MGLLPTALLASLPDSWDLAVGLALAYGRSAESGGLFLGVVEGVIGGRGSSWCPVAVP